jgi:hypothetical protein
MRSIVLAGFFVVVLSLQPGARADGLIFQLPPDGTQVRYDTEGTFVNNGQERMIKGSLTVSSVGKTTAEGEECRWIEFKNVFRTDMGERILIAKCLVPEKDLGKGKSAGEHLIRAWIKQGDSEPQEIRDLKGRGARMLAGYLAGPPNNPGELASADIETLPLGKLSCAGVTGSQEFQRENGSQTINFETRLNEKAPFGVVSALWKFEFQSNGQVVGSGTTKMTLAEINTTALSELPDKN